MGRTKGAIDKAPRKPRASKAQERAVSQAANGNGVNGEQASAVLKTLIENHDERLSIMGSAMSQCRNVRQRDKDLLAGARSDGLPVRALKGRVKEILLERAHRRVRDDMEPDDKALLDQVREATRAKLGPDFADNTPLGRAAMESADAPN